MSIRTKIGLILSFFTVFLLLSACNQEKTPNEKIYLVLENVVAAEKGFEEQQDPLIALEKEENDIYHKMIGLGMKQYDEIVNLSNKALSIADKRKLDMEKETKSIKKSEKEFKKIDVLKVELTDPKLKKLVNDMDQIMKSRYEEHDVLEREYMTGLKYDQHLYKMFKDKNLSFDQVESQINRLNATYKKVYQANDDFNQLTQQYNDKKRAFYKNAGLKVTEK